MKRWLKICVLMLQTSSPGAGQQPRTANRCGARHIRSIPGPTNSAAETARHSTTSYPFPDGGISIAGQFTVSKSARWRPGVYYPDDSSETESTPDAGTLHLARLSCGRRCSDRPDPVTGVLAADRRTSSAADVTGGVGTLLSKGRAGQPRAARARRSGLSAEGRGARDEYQEPAGGRGDDRPLACRSQRAIRYAGL